MNHRIIPGLVALITVPLLLAGCSASGAAHAAAQPHPTVTVTVTAQPEQTGVDQTTYDGCKAAYAQMVNIASKQTSILSGVSFAAQDAFQAVSDGDSEALTVAAGKVGDYSTQEQSLTGDINAVDKNACP